jgi:acetylornithine/N-succinyldiaminopimelate aminotransferase
MSRLGSVRERHPQAITAVRGRGLLVGVDLTPPVGAVLTACRERGLLGLMAGENTLRLAPPLVIAEADVERAVEIVERAVQASAQ